MYEVIRFPLVGWEFFNEQHVDYVNHIGFGDGFGIMFSEGENNLEGWPIGLTSCPKRACDFQ